MLEAIVAKEGELRARLMAARARADEIVARASEEASAWRARELAAAEAQIHAETARAKEDARRSAEERVAGAVEEARALLVDDAAIQAAANTVLSAVLLLPPRGSGPSVGATDGTQ